MVRKKTESKNSWTLFFFTPFLPHFWDSVFFQNTEKTKFSFSHFLTFFRTRVLDTH